MTPDTMVGGRSSAAWTLPGKRACSTVLRYYGGRKATRRLCHPPCEDGPGNASPHGFAYLVHHMVMAFKSGFCSDLQLGRDRVWECGKWGRCLSPVAAVQSAQRSGSSIHCVDVSVRMCLLCVLCVLCGESKGGDCLDVWLVSQTLEGRLLLLKSPPSVGFPGLGARLSAGVASVVCRVSLSSALRTERDVVGLW
jgi:hypothetical protein